MKNLSIGPCVLIFAALLACKGEKASGGDNPSAASNTAAATAAASASAPSTASEPASGEQLDKATVCGLFGKKSDSERCSDCVDDADLSGPCSRASEAFGRCVGDPEAIGKTCAGECVNQCVRGQKACCECTTDCIAKRRPSCATKFLATQKCTFEKCRIACS